MGAVGYDGDGPDVKASLHDVNYTCQFASNRSADSLDGVITAWLTALSTLYAEFEPSIPIVVSISA